MKLKLRIQIRSLPDDKEMKKEKWPVVEETVQVQQLNKMKKHFWLFWNTRKCYFAYMLFNLLNITAKKNVFKLFSVMVLPFFNLFITTRQPLPKHLRAIA